MRAFIIWDIERKRLERERETEIDRGLSLPLPPPDWTPTPAHEEDDAPIWMQRLVDFVENLLPDSPAEPDYSI